MAATIEQIPQHLERDIRDLIQRLRALSDEQLYELAERQRREMLARDYSYNLDDPVDRLELALDGLRVAETNYRLNVIQRVEAEMNGGHLVVVGAGNEIDKFGAYCDPDPPGKFCWEGPDRDTLEEAAEDARRHHPDVEDELI